MHGIAAIIRDHFPNSQAIANPTTLNGMAKVIAFASEHHEDGTLRWNVAAERRKLRRLARKLQEIEQIALSLPIPIHRALETSTMGHFALRKSTGFVEIGLASIAQLGGGCHHLIENGLVEGVLETGQPLGKSPSWSAIAVVGVCRKVYQTATGAEAPTAVRAGDERRSLGEFGEFLRCIFEELGITQTVPAMVDAWRRSEAQRKSSMS